MLRRTEKKENEERKKLRQESKHKLQMSKQEELRKKMVERISYQTEIDRLTNELRQTLGSTSTASFDVRDQPCIQQQRTSLSGSTSYVSKEPVNGLSSGMPIDGTAMQQNTVQKMNDLSRIDKRVGSKDLPRADSERTGADRNLHRTEKELPVADSRRIGIDRDLHRTDKDLPRADILCTHGP